MSWVGELLLNIHNWWNATAKVKADLKLDPNPIQIGVLAAAAINYSAMIDPVQTHPGAILSGIAARSKPKAVEQIAKYGIGSTCKAYGSYEELLADPSIDAVYIPTPNGLHAVWAIKAMEAGKHVLVEKPMASNADEVRQIREVADRTGKIVLEAFHWRFHPAAHRCKEIIDSGKYGAVTSILTNLTFPRGAIGIDDIRLKYDLGGGSCMDLTYVFSGSTYFASRDFSKAEIRVLQATPRVCVGDPKVDEAMSATFVVEDSRKPPVTCKVEADLRLAPAFGFIPQIWRAAPELILQLEKAEITFSNFVLPTYQHALTIKEKDVQGKLTGKKHVEHCYANGPQWIKRGEPWWTTYRYQLEAFIDMIKAKENDTEYSGPWVSLDESEKLMGLIDNVYDKTELPRRGL